MDYMREAFREAIPAIGNSDPNPPVGAILVDPQNGTVLGRGYTRLPGKNHAEIAALIDAEKKFGKEKIEGAHLYVTLEPCSHYGKTPPCVLAIKDYKIGKVIIARKDISEKVDGISYLKEHGIETVFQPDFAEEIEWSLGAFEFAEKNKLPRITLKWAQTADGNIAPVSGPSGPISSSHSREAVFRLRKLFHATLAAPGTVQADRPSLNARYGTKTLQGAISSQGYFEDMLLSFENLDFAGVEQALPKRFFMMPALSKTWTMKDSIDFVSAQQAIGGRFFCFFTDEKQANIHDVDRKILESYDDLDSVFRTILENGALQVLVEAGPVFAEKIFQYRYTQYCMAFISQRQEPWPGVGFSASMALHKDDKNLLQSYGYSVKKEIPLASDRLVILTKN